MYKKGDLVKIIRPVGNSISFPVGAIRKVVKMDCNDSVQLEHCGCTWWVAPSCIQRVEPAQPVVIPEVCCNAPLESIDIITTDYIIPKAECSVCGSIYMSDGSVLKNNPEDSYNIIPEEEDEDLLEEDDEEEEECDFNPFVAINPINPFVGVNSGGTPYPHTVFGDILMPTLAELEARYATGGSTRRRA